MKLIAGFLVSLLALPTAALSGRIRSGPRYRRNDIPRTKWRDIIALFALLIFTILFVTSRLWLIEGDLGPLELVRYQKIDEFYYAGLAFEWLHGRTEPPSLMNEISSLPYGLFYNAIVYLNLKLVGNTYLGLRLNVVAVSLVTSLAFTYILYLRFALAALVVSLPIYLLTLSWFMASLAVEPTIYQLFHLAIFVSLLVWTTSTQRMQNKSSIFSISVVAFSGPLFVYAPNFFIIPALYAYFIVLGIRTRDLTTIKNFLMCSSAALLFTGALWFAMCKLAFGGIGPVLTMLDSVNPAISPKTLAAFLAMVKSNFSNQAVFSFFAETPYVFYTYLVALGLMACRLLYRTFVRTSEATTSATDDIFSLLALAFFFQTLFVNEHPFKKLVLVTPFLIYGSLLIFEWLRRLTLLPTVISAAVFAIYLVTPSAILSKRIMFDGYSENFKTAMISLNDLGPVDVVGGYSHGFRLYNQIKPSLGLYVHKYALRDLPRYYELLAGAEADFQPKYAIGIQLDEDDTEKTFNRLGWKRTRTILHGEKYVGDVALFERR